MTIIISLTELGSWGLPVTPAPGSWMRQPFLPVLSLSGKGKIIKKKNVKNIGMLYTQEFHFSKLSGSFCEIVVLRRIDKSCWSMKRWHQCTEALNSLSAMFLAFAIDFAFRRITVVENPIPAFLFSSIHSFSSFSNSGNLAGQYRAALWSRRRPFNFSCCERHLRTFFSSTWNWRAACVCCMCCKLGTI